MRFSKLPFTRIRTLFAIAIVAVFVATTATPALAANGQKIGFVDINKVTEDSKFIQDLLNDIEEKLARQREEISQKEDEYSDLRAEIQNKQSVLKESELEDLRQQGRHLRTEIEDQTYDLQRALDKAQKEQMGPALDLVLDTVQKVAREEGFDLVLRGEVVLYGAPTADITDRVVKKLDSENTVAEFRQNASKRQESSGRRPALSTGGAALPLEPRQ